MYLKSFFKNNSIHVYWQRFGSEQNEEKKDVQLYLHVTVTWKECCEDVKFIDRHRKRFVRTPFFTLHHQKKKTEEEEIFETGAFHFSLNFLLKIKKNTEKATNDMSFVIMSYIYTYLILHMCYMWLWNTKRTKKSEKKRFVCLCKPFYIMHIIIQRTTEAINREKKYRSNREYYPNHLIKI